MAAITRKPFEGVWNIIRFNRHFYVGVIIIWATLLVANNWLPTVYQSLVGWLTLLSILAVLGSLVVSYYVYDLSELYALNWLPDLSHKRVLNIHAGFDETSTIIRAKYPACQLDVCDFYDPNKHTELSIKLARAAYPPYPDTQTVDTSYLPFTHGTFDYVVVIFSAHEIRKHEECIQFFQELNRIITSEGQVLVTEHVRDLNNTLAYTFGVFHFFSRSRWLKTFTKASLRLKQEEKVTPFVTTFILEKDGVTH